MLEGGGSLPEERRLITALFADVSGFTSLADRLDPEQLLEVIDPVISGLSSIVGRYGGYVEKFAGDALLALFGAPISHEDDPERACLVALDMHRELARIADDLPYDATLTLHAGINSGHGIARILGSEARMDYAVLGDSVILAQRLESSAPKGETYVSELTYRLAGHRFEFEPVGELTLKGKAEPVPAWRLLGERSRRPSRRDDDAARPLIGRDADLEAIDAVLEALSKGEGSVMTLLGEPGVGKSRLTGAARHHAAARGIRWLDTRCLSYGAGIAYWPYSELLRRFAETAMDELPTETLERLARALGPTSGLPFFARLLGLPESSELTTSLEPEAFRRGLHDAFAEWLAGLARETPTVVAFEDVHWADASSLELTSELVRVCATERLVFYFVARPDAAPALAELAPDARALQLGPLDVHGVGSLIASTLGGDAPAGLASAITDRTQGNPLFVKELVRALRDTGDLERRNGRWTMRAGWDSTAVPPTIEGVIAARIDLLPREDASLLGTTALIGRRVRRRLLQAVADGPDLEAHLANLVGAGFLDRIEEGGEPGFTFHHALVQDVAYSRLLRRHRRDLHRRVADAAESLYGAGDDVLDLLARHLYLGEAGTKAVDYLVRAAARAKGLYANEEAIQHLGRAAEVAEREQLADRLAQLQVELGDLYTIVGRYDDALAAYTAGRDHGNDVRAWRGLAAAHRLKGDFPAALAIVDQAFGTEELRGADLAPLWLEQGWTLSVAGHLNEAVDVLDAALAAAPQQSDPVTGHLLLQLARAETLLGRLDSALQHGKRADAMFDEAGDLRGLSTAARLVGDTFRNLGRFDEASQTLRRGLELAERVGSVEEIGGCLLNLALVERQRGRLDEAVACDLRAIAEFERVGHATGRATGYSNLAYKLLHAGDYEEALRYCGKALELGRSIGHAATIASTIDTVASIALAQDDFAEAVTQAEEAAALYLQMGVAAGAIEALKTAAEALERSGAGERAREMLERARTLSESVPVAS